MCNSASLFSAFASFSPRSCLHFIPSPFSVYLIYPVLACRRCYLRPSCLSLLSLRPFAPPATSPSCSLFLQVFLACRAIFPSPPLQHHLLLCLSPLPFEPFRALFRFTSAPCASVIPLSPWVLYHLYFHAILYISSLFVCSMYRSPLFLSAHVCSFLRSYGADLH